MQHGRLRIQLATYLIGHAAGKLYRLRRSCRMLSASFMRTEEGGEHEIELNRNTSAAELLGRIGRMPLPPYIKRDKGHDARDDDDRQRYQTVYARQPGAIAAPTAGLHFTPELIEELERKG